MDFNVASTARRSSSVTPHKDTKPGSSRPTRREQQKEAKERSRKTVINEAIKNALTHFPRDLLIHSDNLTASRDTSQSRPTIVSPTGPVKFKELGLPERLQKSIEGLNFSAMTPIQAQTFSSIREGKNVVARSPTGTGKTLAFLVPLLSRLLALPDGGARLQRTDGIRIVILSPTRELALQTFEIAQKLLRPFPYIVPVCLCGGEARAKEKARIRKGANILVGTPGRVLDHVRQTAVLTGTCGPLEAVVLDECDVILDMGLGVTVREIWSALESGRKKALGASPTPPVTGLSGASASKIFPIQYILFSATANEKVADLAKDITSPLFIVTDAAGKSAGQKGGAGTATAKEGVQISNNEAVALPPALDHSFVVCPLKLRIPLLFGMIAGRTALVFVQTGDEAVFLDALCRSIPGTPKSFALHGSMAQADRRDIITRIRKAVASPNANGEHKGVCIFATDVVARGIDLPALELVVQYDAPAEAAQYVHRIGRTARIGNSGRAILVLHPSEIDYTTYISKICVPPRPQQLEAALAGLRAMGEYTGDKGGILGAAAKLQTVVEDTVAASKTLHNLAISAMRRYISSYSVREKDIKLVFNSKLLHLGHLAKSFGLRETPSEVLHPSGARTMESFGKMKSIPTKRESPTQKNNNKKFKLGTTVLRSQGRDMRLAGTGEMVSLPPPGKKMPRNRREEEYGGDGDGDDGEES